MQKDILLTTINSTYFHTAFGLRYLFANLKEFQTHSKIVEFTKENDSKDIVQTLLRYQPRIIGFSVYIWNAKQIEEVVGILKKVTPDTLIVLGGPEVSYEQDAQPLYRLANYIIAGEGDFLFYEFCRNYFSENKLPSEKKISGPLPLIAQIESPYPYYSKEDIEHRVIYVEASRGCPYKCEFCLSSLDNSVRNFDLNAFLSEMENLIQKGVRQFKFVDRTFNLSPQISSKILEFFLSHINKGLFLHFEMVPDRLPDNLKNLITKFPVGSLQFEIGVQTWNPFVANLVSRKQDYIKTAENIKFLIQETHVHVHADLIVGLPGEDIHSFAKGFDTLCALNPHEIQIGILKRLKGTPIIRHDREWGMLYQEESPFQILQTKVLSFTELQTLSRFAKFWDLYANSGNFNHSILLIKQNSPASFFWGFYLFSEFLSERHPQRHSISLLNLTKSAWVYLTDILHIEPSIARIALAEDYSGKVKRDLPDYLKQNVLEMPQIPIIKRKTATPNRQSRHLV